MYLNNWQICSHNQPLKLHHNTFILFFVRHSNTLPNTSSITPVCLCLPFTIVLPTLEIVCALSYVSILNIQRLLHHQSSVNKTEAAVFSCRLCFLRAFPFISFLFNMSKKQLCMTNKAFLDYWAIFVQPNIIFWK